MKDYFIVMGFWSNLVDDDECWVEGIYTSKELADNEVIQLEHISVIEGDGCTAYKVIPFLGEIK